MPMQEGFGQGTGRLAPAPEPQRKVTSNMTTTSPIDMAPGGAMGDAPWIDPEVAKWIYRQNQWYKAFNQKIRGRISRYWQIWRAYDQGPAASAGQEWRDRTVIPQAFKELAARVPRIVLGQWSGPEIFKVSLRDGEEDLEYETLVESWIQSALDAIGTGDPDMRTFLRRMSDAVTYQQIMGHVWYKIRYRKIGRMMKQRIPSGYDPEGKPISWSMEQFYETLFDNVDIDWLQLSNLAIDMHAKPRRWAIERVSTSLETLREDDRVARETTGEALYPGLAELETDMINSGPVTLGDSEEPRDTEGWPFTTQTEGKDFGETQIELWLCWDNVQGTLTKIANRSVILDHGLADTKDGLDPYVGVPAVPLPGIPIGDSIFNWTSSLYTRQTRLARARMDETMMNMFSQVLIKEGAITPTQAKWVFRPGGITQVKSNDTEKPISDSVYMMPRRNVPPEGYNEEAYSQQQSESIAGADSVTRGSEATDKSRDVSAAEINQRAAGSDVRYRWELLYQDVAGKRPILQKIFDTLQLNATEPRAIKLANGQRKQVNLQDIRRPVDFVVAGILEEGSMAERLQEIDRLVALSKQDAGFAPFLKYREVLRDVIRSSRMLKRRSDLYLKTEEEVKSEQQQRAAQEAAAQGQPGTVPGESLGGTLALPPGVDSPGSPGSSSVFGADAGNDGSAPPDAGGVIAEI